LVAYHTAQVRLTLARTSQVRRSIAKAVRLRQWLQPLQKGAIQ
jgi:hypothetical protein